MLIVRCTVCDEPYEFCTCPPYSAEDYNHAMKLGLDLDDWNDYCKYYGLGEQEVYE